MPGVTRIAVGDPNVVEVKTGGNGQLIIRGEGAGTTTLLVSVSNQRPVRYRVTVAAKNHAN